VLSTFSQALHCVFRQGRPWVWAGGQLLVWQDASFLRGETNVPVSWNRGLRLPDLEMHMLPSLRAPPSF